MQGLFVSELHSSHSTFDVFESILHLIYGGVPFPFSKTGYVQKQDQDVTTIHLRATVIYVIIITLAIVLCPMKELLVFVLVHHGKIQETDLLPYDYN